MPAGRRSRKACLTCHPDSAAQIMATTHWTWESAPEMADWRGETVTIGKKNQINNFCISAQGNEKTCMSCHAGYGWEDDQFDFSDPHKVDCLVCHADRSTYGKGDYGYPAEGVDLTAAAQSVGLPTREELRHLSLRRRRRQQRQTRRPGLEPQLPVRKPGRAYERPEPAVHRLSPHHGPRDQRPLAG